MGIPDLLGSQMFVRYYTATDMPPGPPHSTSFNSLVNQVKIAGLVLAFKVRGAFASRKVDLRGM